MANNPNPANFSPTVPDFPEIGHYQPIYGKFDLTTYVQGSSDYEIMAFLVQCYNATLKGYSEVTQLSKDTVTAYNQLQTWVNTWFDELDVQQEINNKLQAMYEAGTLAEAIGQSNAIPPAVAQYLNSEDGKKNLSDVTAQKIEAMAENGTLGTVINNTGTVQRTTTNWLQQNVTPKGSAVVVDKSLSIEGAAADAKSTGDIRKEIADKIPVGVEIKNYFSPSNMTSGGYIDVSTGNVVSTDNWSYSSFLPTKAGATLCTVNYDTADNSWKIIATTYLAFYDVYKKYISGKIAANDTTYDVPSNAAYMRVSVNNYYVTLNTMIIVDKSYFDVMKSVDDNVPYGNYIPTIYDRDGKEFTVIESPYCLKEGSKLYFKFDRIVYYKDGVRNEYIYAFPTLKDAFPNNWQGYPTSKVKDCMFLNAEEALVFNNRTSVLNIVTIPYFLNNTGENSVLLGFDNHHVVFGMLAHQYKDLNDNEYERQRFDTISSDVLTKLYNQVNPVYNTVTDDKFCFAWLSDNHMYGTVGEDETDMTDLAIGYADKSLNFNAIFNTGDSIQERDGVSGLNALRKVVDRIDAKKLVYCEGNHDRNVITPILTKLEFYNSVYRHNTNEVVWGSKDNAYFYRDYTSHKIRVIVLNVYEHLYDNDVYNESLVGYSNEQLNWLANTALQVNDGWSVIVLTHDSPVQLQNSSFDGHNNSTQLVEILESFKAGTSTNITYTDTKHSGLFSVNVTTNFNKAGNIIGVLSGHAHCDDSKTVNGINYIQILCAYIDVVNEYSGFPNRPAFSDKAYVFDIGLVDTTNRKLTLARIGYGDNREFSY